MRSIFAKILFWSLGTFVLSLVAYGAIWRALEHRGPPKDDPIHGVIDLVRDQACRAYEEGGGAQLSTYLTQIRRYLPGEHFLTDASGRDLVTGGDRAELLRLAQAPGEPRRLPDGCFVHVAPAVDGRYRFISKVRPWFRPPNILPYYGAVVLVITLMGAILAAHLAAPLRRLRRLVDRFGRGDLAARAQWARRDEIGELSRSFDEMAGRIETLLGAERRLLQDVSHELRSPLTRLDVAVDLASTATDPAEYLARIRRDISRLSVLVDELLQLTRAESDRLAHADQNVRLDELLCSLIEDCELEAQASKCRLMVLKADRCSIRGEAESLRRAVENVLRNAIRHAPEGTAVEVGLERSGAIASIEVRDRGVGVPDDLLNSIFEPFFRVENDRSRASGGVGLGLAIARRAVLLHGGSISAANADPGLAVRIMLPLGPEEGE